MNVKESIVVSSLSSTSYLILNKKLLLSLDGDATAAVVLTELMLKHQFYKEQRSLVHGDYFFYTSDLLESNLGIKRSAQDHAIKKLLSLGLISSILSGFPKKRHFSINYDKMYFMLYSTDEV